MIPDVYGCFVDLHGCLCTIESTYLLKGTKVHNAQTHWKYSFLDVCKDGLID